MSNRINIRDLAKMLGVSVSTVSKALNDKSDISPSLAKQIREKAEELNYRPNHIASGLRNKKSKLIALIIPEITMYFFPSVIKGIEDHIKQFGYRLMVFQSKNDLSEELRNIEICIQQNVDGVLLSITHPENSIPHLEMLVENDIPFVLFDKGVEREGFFEVMINDYNVSKMAANHLVQRGCKRILALLGNSEMSISRKRAKGFSEEMKKAGFSNFEMCFVKDFEDGKLMVEEEFKKKKFDGLFVMSDELLAASSKFVYSEMKNGVELNVVAISDGFLPHLFDFKVDYFHHDGFLLGQKSAERMLAIMNDENSKMLPDFYLELEVSLKSNNG
ncbi:MAG: hypothetical protein RLZZ91_314 [Bacteroidota bacterium]